MATPISRTWLQMKLSGRGGAPCQTAQQIFDTNFPGGTDSTSIDALTWNNFFRPNDLGLIIPSYIREMSAAQRRTLVIWLLQQVQSRLPVGWAKTAAISAKITDVIDCLNAPTVAKRNALQAYASSIVVDYSESRSRYFEITMMGMCNLVANQISDHYDVDWLVGRLMKLGWVIAGVSKEVVEEAVMFKIEQIIGIRD